MSLIQELIGMGVAPSTAIEATINEGAGKYQCQFHPKDVASSVKEFRKFLESCGYTSEDGDYLDVKYLGYADHHHVYLMLAHDDNEDELMISKFFASFDKDAKLTGDFAGVVLHTFAMDEEDEAQEKFDSIKDLAGAK